MEDSQVKNTLVFKFPAGAPAPSLVEMGRFAKSLDADLDEMDTMYKVTEEKCVYLKFKSEGAMKEAAEQNPAILPFRYSNGNKVEVKMDIAGNYVVKYVRIFELRPEVPDSEIIAVLAKYGTVKRLVREKFPAELELNMFTEVRGVHIEVKKEPASLFFLGRRGRIFYEGLKQKCFTCKQEGHLKADCPQNKKKYIDVPETQRPGPSGSVVSTTSHPSYSDALSGGIASHVQDRLKINMVPLVSANKQKKPLVVQESENEEEGTLESGSMEVDNSVDKMAVKRQHSAAGDSGGTDEDAASGFVQVENKRASRRLKISPSPLDAIVSVPKSKKEAGKKGNRSKSK